MKHLLLTAIVFIKLLPGFGQVNEMPVYSNGLVYSDASIRQLKSIADSLNRKYQHTSLSKKYYSVPQGVVNAVELSAGDISGALKDISDNISYGDFIKKYPVLADSNLLVSTYKGYNYYHAHEDLLFYELQIPGKYAPPRICVVLNTPGMTDENGTITGTVGNWIVEYTRPGKYSKEHLRAFYITQPIASKPLPDTYARLILYSDCMVDTTTGIYFNDAGAFSVGDYRFVDTGRYINARAFIEYIKQSTAHLPKKFLHPSPEAFGFNDSIAKKRFLRLSAEMPDFHFNDSVVKKYVEDTLSHTAFFKRSLAEAVEESLRFKVLTSDDFEYYTAQYYSKEAALTLIRGRRVSAECNIGAELMGRRRAMKIASLAADLANWQAFLPAHLQMISDYNDRVVYGNYAQKDRKTYVREIEDLNVNIENLLLGISLGIANPSGNNSSGGPWRIAGLGHIFAESKNRKSIEQKLLYMIEDSRLDDYNRLLMHYLFLDYTYYLPDQSERIACEQRLAEADKSLPACLSSRIAINKKLFEMQTR